MSSTNPKSPGADRRPGQFEELAEATIRFSGDTGDGMHLTGTQFALTSAIFGNETTSLPDFPAEIRAPAGTLPGVAGVQVHISMHDRHTPGDALDALVAMNPASLRVNLADLKPGGVLLVNSDAFTADEWVKAGYAADPLEDGSLEAYRLFAVPMTTLCREAGAKINLSPREADRCRNFFALGLACWIYDRPLEPIQRWIRDRFAKNPAAMEGNLRALRAGGHYADSKEKISVRFRVAKETPAPGRYRIIAGSEALALGLAAGSQKADLDMVFASYPITPASDILHQFCDWNLPGVTVMQAEDEMAALSVALGASFGGALGVTATSGPGMCLKSEALGLAVMTELPCVIVNVQRAGPSTGLPTKTEQADLLQALFGRHGESPIVVLAAASPSDCFRMAFEAVRIAIRFMTPVILLTDSDTANGSDPWRIPDLAALPSIDKTAGVGSPVPNRPFQPYQRDARLVRPWVIPGTPGHEHRIGGLEKEDPTGDVCYEPLNHEWMVAARAKKIANVADEIPEAIVDGPEDAELLVVGWGGTFGTIQAAMRRCRKKGMKVAGVHLNYLNPLPKNLGAVLKKHRQVLVPELNQGQLLWHLRSRFLVDAAGLNKTQGRQFLISEIERKIESMLRS